jgi:hypothetical protein
VADVLLVTLELALGILVPWWIVKRDLRRLTGAQLDRAWNDASFWLAIVAFGPLCLPFHFTKTRRSVVGLLLGLLWMIAAFVLIALISAAAGWLLGAS